MNIISPPNFFFYKQSFSVIKVGPSVTDSSHIYYIGKMIAVTVWYDLESISIIVTRKTVRPLKHADL